VWGGGGDQEVPEWALQWLVAGNRTCVYQLQGGQRARPCESAANWLLLHTSDMLPLVCLNWSAADVRLLVTRRR